MAGHGGGDGHSLHILRQITGECYGLPPPRLVTAFLPASLITVYGAGKTIKILLDAEEALAALRLLDKKDEKITKSWFFT